MSRRDFYGTRLSSIYSIGLCFCLLQQLTRLINDQRRPDELNSLVVTRKRRVHVIISFVTPVLPRSPRDNAAFSINRTSTRTHDLCNARLGRNEPTRD